MDQEEKLDSSGAYAFKPLLEKPAEDTPEEYSNPAGSGRGECNAEQDAEQDADHDPECDLEVTAQTQDQVLEETKPGFGIRGFEGEEVGGG